MKRTVFLAIVVLLLSGCNGKVPADIEAAQALARRVMGPSRARQIDFRLLEESVPDAFRLETARGRIVISGNNAGSMAVGLNEYLRSVCHVSVGWFKEDRIKLPRRLPRPAAPIERTARVSQRFFLNYCTSGYTLPWWKWEDWEHFIDWMALNGVNLPLAVSGQEAIWYEIWTELGLSDEEVRSYFTGPSHLPWHRMLNIDHWGGPLPKSWLSGQMELQKRIVKRERELSMRPVLPAFAGHVPAALSRVCPEAKIEKLSLWGGFTEEYVPSFLDPLDPLFEKIQKAFIEKQTAAYGTDHVYGIDLFNEMTPPSWEPEYLATVGSHAYEALAAADPQAVWLQMGWLFWYQRGDWTPERVKAYLTSYPASQQILLDYYCETQEVWRRTESFFGVPYIWCYLGNFGGNTFLGGDLSLSGERIEETLRSGGENLAGIGCTLEALDCNPWSYEYILSKAWDDWTPDQFASSLASCRSGLAPEKAAALDSAWRVLFEKVYTKGNGWLRDPLVNHRPSLRAGRGTFDDKYGAQYDNAVLRDMLQALLASEGSGRAFDFDLVNFSRQWLTNMCANLYYDYYNAVQSGDREAMEKHSQRFLGILDDLDGILAYEPYFLLGKWISDARAWGKGAAEADYFERDARNLITTWGDRGRELCDYACRSLNGLVSDFYKVRWEMLFNAVDTALDDHGEYTSEDADAYHEAVCDFEMDWWRECRGRYPATPSRASLRKAVGALLEKY